MFRYTDDWNKKKCHSFPSIVGTLIHVTSEIALSIASSFHRLVSTRSRISPDAVVEIEEYFSPSHEGVKISITRRFQHPVKYRTGGVVVCFVLLPDAPFCSFNVGRKKC
ncbi:hypothetical protein CEXT_794371 [Caerostris extrusa]|uniref:Uncharacterized protein n=1 Tax=Caerostris extrusa TaxID=172846 RepID=A0AAV4Y0X7_CAEEX|nr:hypothetical protein CEXT_794371 [Caerostris extrusa]